MKNIVGIMIVALTLGLGVFSLPVSAEEAFKKVVIDPGHGGADPGSSGHGLEEKALTLQIGTLINNYLNNNYDVETIMTRTSDETISLQERSTMANEWNADFYLSTHINAGGGSGFEDFTFRSRTMQDPRVNAESKRIQKIIHTEIQQVLVKYNVRDRGSKEANFHVLRETHMPSVLTETLFIDNEADAKLLKNQNFINDIAIAHSVGIAKALDLPIKSVTSTPEPTPTPTNKVYETTANVNLRSGAGVQNNYLTTVKKGTKMTITNTQNIEDVTWGYGKANNTKGWLSMDYMKEDKNSVVTPKPEVKPNIPSDRPTFNSSKVLKLGDRGAIVGSLQQVLNYNGYKLVVDNIFGKGTDTAVRDFQRKNGLVADGRPGTATQAKFEQVSNGGTVVKPSVPSTKPNKPVNPTIPTFKSSKVLKLGDRGAVVGSLQQVLNYNGYKLVVDNIFGNGTDKALKDFQRKNGLVADGRPGTATQAKFEQISNGGTVVKPSVPSKKPNKPTFKSSKVLKLGDRGAVVGSLQRVLNYNGYKLVVDNIFGNGTDKALRDFQRKNGLVADGRPGTATQAKFEQLK